MRTLFVPYPLLDHRIPNTVNSMLTMAGEIAPHLEAANDLFAVTPYEVVVASVPSISKAIEFVRSAKRFKAKVVITVLPAGTPEGWRVLNAGADAVTVNPSAEEVTALIRAARRRHGDISTISYGDVSFEGEDGGLMIGGQPVHIPLAQRRILAALVANAGRTVPTDSIARAIWSVEEQPFDWEHVYRSQVCKLRSNLANLGSRLAIVTDRGVGLRLQEAAPAYDGKRQRDASSPSIKDRADATSYGDIALVEGSDEVVIAGKPIRLATIQGRLLNTLVRNGGSTVPTGELVIACGGEENTSFTEAAMRIKLRDLRRTLGRCGSRLAVVSEFGSGVRLDDSDSAELAA